MPNKLAAEKSPYLQQHAENPVNWFPWGDEAFQKAKTENKPVFLSIGYATCHWCHVMAHESFEDPEIAALMNDAFINVKVDREERPDIDSMYMTVCQMINGHGGWPLTIVMTPQKEPFFAATYIPREARFNRIGMRQLIPGISGMWKHERERITKAAEKIKEGFQKAQQTETGHFPGPEAYNLAAAKLTQSYDGEYGGFAEAPKFPTPHNLMFLLRQWKLKNDDYLLEMVTNTLTKMRLGGIWDHIGFGFHRYSTDYQWLLSHFEKMLYDQALLMMAYTEAWQATKNPLFRQTVYEIAGYVTRNLQHPEGAFYSAEDADSDGEEGKFYVWEMNELASTLPEEDALKFGKLFGIKEEGNFKDEATGELTGKNIPHLKNPLDGEETGWFEKIRLQLMEKREQRTRPLLDDKILTDWNALMIAALAKAGFAFSEPTFIHAAASAYTFIEKNLIAEHNLLHRFKDDEAAIAAMADDYAFLIWASIELYEATFEPTYLEKAILWNQGFINKFWDKENNGFYLSINDEDQVFGRQKQVFDGAIPSANSVAMMNNLRLSRLTGNIDLENYTDEIGKLFSADLLRSGYSITYGMQSIQFLNAETKEISFVGEDELEEAIKHFATNFSPFSVHHVISDDNREQLNKLADYTSSQQKVDKKPTLYICENFACELPVVGVDEIRKMVIS